jgi:hypothetical protein
LGVFGLASVLLFVRAWKRSASTSFPLTATAGASAVLSLSDVRRFACKAAIAMCGDAEEGIELAVGRP